MPYGFNDDRSKSELGDITSDIDSLKLGLEEAQSDIEELQSGLQGVSATVQVLAGVQIEAGEIEGASIAANRVRTVNVTFEKAFASEPHIVISLTSASQAVEYGDITAWVYSKTKSGFVACIANKNSGTRAPWATYIAVGEAVTTTEEE